MFLAEISILNLGYLIFLHKDEIYKKNMKRSDKVSIILSILAILALSVFVEYGMRVHVSPVCASVCCMTTHVCKCVCVCMYPRVCVPLVCTYLLYVPVCVYACV